MALQFDIDFEAGDFSELDDSVGGAELYVSTTGAISGTYSCNHDWDTTAQAVRNNCNFNSSNYRIGHRIKVKGTFGWGDTQTQVSYFDWLNGTAQYQLNLKKSGSDVVVVLIAPNDTFTGTTNIDDGATHTVEIRIIKGTFGMADGTDALYVDGVLVGENTSSANWDEVEAAEVGTNNWQWTRLRSDVGSGHTGGIITDDWILRDDDTEIYPAGAASDEFDAATIPKPCSISADGSFIYIGVLDSLGQPELIKFSTAINADGSAVFAPGAGDNIGVQCSRGDADEVTVAGQFDGTNVVERSEDAGSSFSVIDDATIGGVAAFVVGPDSDNRILVFDEDTPEILETIDEGTTWTSKNATLTESLRVLARLGVDVQQVIAGASSTDSAQVLHSPNSGAELENIELDAFGSDVDTNGIIVN